MFTLPKYGKIHNNFMQKDDLKIIFEDDFLIAVNKPAGILVVPTDKGEKHTLTNVLNEIVNLRGVPFTICPCHRLDRDTSGIVLFAKNKEMEQKMFAEFKNRRIKKKYIALVSGWPKYNNGIIDKRIDGMEAVTKYQVIKKREGYSILEVEPVTGRTNQIRIHLKIIGNPVLGERKYAFGRDFKVKFRRTALHARELAFIHPVTGKYITLKAEIPEDMKKMI